MGLQAPAKTDVRMCPGAYIRSGCRLFYVLGEDALGRLLLEDCYLLTVAHVMAKKVRDEYELVRAAP